MATTITRMPSVWHQRWNVVIVLAFAVASSLAPVVVPQVAAAERHVVDPPPAAPDVAAPVAELPPPVFTSPADGARLPGILYGISGTGIPGATINMTPARGPIVVETDGTWSAPFIPPLFPAEDYEFTVTQTVGAETSGPASLSFSLYVAPRILSPVDDYVFPLSEAPVEVAGFAAQGSIVRAVLDGVSQAAEATPDPDGLYRIRFDSAVQPGAHEVSVTEELNGDISIAVVATFTVEAGAVAEPSSPSGTLPDESASRLPETGVSVSPLGVVLILLGGVITCAVGWRRRWNRGHPRAS